MNIRTRSMRRLLRGAALTLLATTLAAGGCARRATPAVAPALTAPDSFRVAFQTTAGRFDVVAHRQLAPLGVDRFYELVRANYYDGARFFRVVPGFVAQFGIAADSATTAAWRGRRIRDEPVLASNRRGTVAFARGGPDTRTVQLYINLADNPKLDTLNTFGFPPIGAVADSGMAVVDALHDGYGEGAPRGRGPAQDSISRQGDAYLAREFPLLDRIVTARIVAEWR